MSSPPRRLRVPSPPLPQVVKTYTGRLGNVGITLQKWSDGTIAFPDNSILFPGLDADQLARDYLDKKITTDQYLTVYTNLGHPLFEVWGYGFGDMLFECVDLLEDHPELFHGEIVYRIPDKEEEEEGEEEIDKVLH